ncbi:MAG: methyl-accepting chemotaxis protein, partial [Myxococcota bacterium]|nr:methyl-accepting chemotaxis protein [Myxococcota bacterium]
MNEPERHTVGDDKQNDRQKLLLDVHLSVQGMTVRFGAPMVLCLSVVAAAFDRCWQTGLFLGGATFSSLTWFYCLRLTKRGSLRGSVLALSLSTIATAFLYQNLFAALSFTAIIATLAVVIYASFYSHRLLWVTAGFATAGLVLSVFVEALHPWARCEMHPVVHLVFGIAFSVFLMGMVVLVLSKNQKLDSALSHRMFRMNEEQSQIIGTAGAVSTVLEESLRQIRDIAGAFAAQAYEQATAIAQIHATMEQLRQVSEQTATSSGETRRLTEEVRSKSLSTSDQLRAVEKEFDRVVESNTLAQSEFDELAAQADRIEDILHSNREIVAQIKILAVNAGIQAAKAGSFGAGFRVVAGELKAMIQRTEESLSSSRRLLDDIRMRARQSADTVQHNSTMLTRHFDQLGATGQVIEEITS